MKLNLRICWKDHFQTLHYEGLNKSTKITKIEYPKTSSFVPNRQALSQDPKMTHLHNSESALRAFCKFWTTVQAAKGFM